MSSPVYDQIRLPNGACSRNNSQVKPSGDLDGLGIFLIELALRLAWFVNEDSVGNLFCSKFCFGENVRSRHSLFLTKGVGLIISFVAVQNWFHFKSKL